MQISKSDIYILQMRVQIYKYPHPHQSTLLPGQMIDGGRFTIPNRLLY